MIPARRLIVGGLLAVLQGSGALADDPDPWTVTPYLWLPTVNAELRFDLPPGDGDTSVSTEIGPSDYLTDLNAVLMVALERRHERWTFGGDLVWLDFTADTSSVRTVTGDGGTISIPRETDFGTRTDLSGVATTFSASWRWTDSDRFSAAVLGGFRYFDLDIDLYWQLSTTIPGPGFTFDRVGVVSAGTDFLDPIVGVRGDWRFGEGGHWYVPYYLDVGTGSSDLTWQAMAGVGYRFTRASLLVAWRQLEYDDDDTKLVRELKLGGLGVAFGWRF